MELMCPNCMKKLNIPEQYAGQLMRCPMCQGTFTAPALAPASPPEAPPPPAPAPFSFAQEPPPPQTPFSYAPEPPFQAQPPAPPREEPPVVPEAVAPALPPGEYRRCCIVYFSPRVVPWIAPASLLLVFLFSFFPWFSNIEGRTISNAWNIGFGHGADGIITVFLIFMLLAFLLSIPGVLMAFNIIPVPPVLNFWRPVIVGGIALLAFLFLSIKYLHLVLSPTLSMVLWFKLTWRLQFLAVVCLALEFWLELRKSRNAPPPKIEVHC